MAMMDYQSVWKDLKTDFSAFSEGKLRSALCRTTHYEKQEVASLRDKESEVSAWLNNKGLKAGTLYSWIIRQKPSEYSSRYTEKRHQEKMKWVFEIKTELLNVFPEKNVEEIRHMVRRVSRHKYGEVKSLTQEECVLKDVLLRKNVKPTVLYKWLCFGASPEEFEKTLFEKNIAPTTVQRLLANRERQRKAVLEINLLESARKMVQDALR